MMSKLTNLIRCVIARNSFGHLMSNTKLIADEICK